MKKFLALLIAAMLVLSTVAAFATAPSPTPTMTAYSTANANAPAGSTTDGKGKLVITNADPDGGYKAYEIFHASYKTSPDPLPTDANGNVIPNTVNDQYKIAYSIDKNILGQLPTQNVSGVDYPILPDGVTVNRNIEVEPGYYGIEIDDTKVDAAKMLAWLQTDIGGSGANAGKKVYQLFPEHTFTQDGETAYVDVVPGYYYVNTALGSAVMLDSALDSAYIVDKSPTVPGDPDKNITGEPDDETRTDANKYADGTTQNFGGTTEKTANDAAVGDIEEFTIDYNALNFITTKKAGATTNTPEDYITESIEQYVFTDAPTGLDIDIDSLYVTVDGTALPRLEKGDATATPPTEDAWYSFTRDASTGEVTKTAMAAAPTDGKYYTVEKDTNGKMTITVPWVKAPTMIPNPAFNSSQPESESNPRLIANDAAGAGEHLYTAGEDRVIPIKAIYKAAVTADAITKVAENEVEVKFTNKQGQDQTTGSDKTTTTTYKFALDKVDNNGASLTGATFQIKDANKGNALIPVKYVETLTCGIKVHRVMSADELAADIAAAVAAAENATYEDDTDMSAPGAQTAAQKKDAAIAAAQNSTSYYDIVLDTAEAKSIIKGLDKSDYVLSETVVPDGYNRAADTTVTADKLTACDATHTDTHTDMIDGGKSNVDVINKSGSELPSTGGVGTTIFYIVGSMLVLGAAILMVTKRRASAR